MADICVIYVSEDESITGRLVDLLRKHWDVFWAKDINHGNWEERVRAEIKKSRAVVSIHSDNVVSERTAIVVDEMRYAQKCEKPLLPFIIGTTEIPLGFGRLDRTDATGWSGQEGQIGYRKLKAKLGRTLGPGRKSDGLLTRPKELSIRAKTLQLPAFVFSLSSHETQVSPREGMALLEFLAPRAVLVSSYDAWKYYKHSRTFQTSMRRLAASHSLLVLDSGNYEAYRKNDRHSPAHRKGWSRTEFRAIANAYSPDFAFAFDDIEPKGRPEKIARRIARSVRADARALANRSYELCPIVHLPTTATGYDASAAPEVVALVATELEPLVVGIPERELGAGLVERVRTVRAIRRALDSLNRYYPLHLLGTGNPLSMVALAAAGADMFDGLEWCRTVADYDNDTLHHFQHFDFFRESRVTRIQNPIVRKIVEDPKATYAERALSYNVDYFEDLTRTMQSLIHTDQIKVLLDTVPNIASDLLSIIAA